MKGANTMKTFWCSIIGVAATGLMAATATAQVQPWDKQVNNQNRFKVLGLFGNAAVLDQETGLVWEKSPSSILEPWSPRNPDTAHILCNVKAVGNRLGWRLPTIQELGSLLDPTQSRPPLTPGHPFVLTTAQQTGQFWSATTAATDPVSPNSAWFIDFDIFNFPEGLVLYGAGDKTTPRFVWCVRTGPGIDIQ
jgi:hypothetical protein